MEGRLTLNPIAHIDPFGTILLPLLCLIFPSGILLGYARPVPINPWNLRNPRRDMALVAVAGPRMKPLPALARAPALGAIPALHPPPPRSIPPPRPSVRRGLLR